MKRYLNQVTGLLSLLFICLALTTRPTANFQDEINIGVTQELSKKAPTLDLPMNYFLVKSVAFLTEANKQIADQQQKELSFNFAYEILETNTLYKEGDILLGKGKALFVTDSRDHWHLHHITLE